jgi:hypothetical protein
LEAYKELAKLWFEEVWNKGRREAIRELLAPGAEISDGTDARKGTEGFYPFFDRCRLPFPIFVSQSRMFWPKVIRFVFDGYARCGTTASA